jgi:hypothetical protein
MNRHFILTNGRSGSNHFVQLLNQHPAIVNYGEVLGDWTLAGRRIRPFFRGEDGAARFLDWMYESDLAFSAGQAVSLAARVRSGRKTHFRRRRAVASLGVKEFAVNLARHGLGGYLAERSDLRLITLVRENPLERYLSAKTLAATGTVARTGAAAAQRAQTTLNPKTLLADLAVIEAENETVRRAGIEHKGPVFRLVYEDYFGASSKDRLATLEALQTFLGVAPAPLASEHRRLRQTKLSEAIANFDEVRETLVGTPFERWLEAAL